MSTSFQIFPTTKNKPACNEIIKYSMNLFCRFLQKEKISCDIEITASEVSCENKVYNSPKLLVSNEDNYTSFTLNNEGDAYVFYHKIDDIDKDFWDEELKENKKAKSLKEKIDANLGTGYYWSVKRTVGQPVILSLYYGYLAIAIAVLTDGIIYSDDGAWDYSSFPIEGIAFENEYLNIEKLSDTTIKESVENWLDILKKM